MTNLKETIEKFYQLEEKELDLKNALEHTKKEEENLIVNFLIESQYLNQISWEVDCIEFQYKKLYLKSSVSNFSSNLIRILTKLQPIKFFYKKYIANLQYSISDDSVFLAINYNSSPSLTIQECQLTISKISQSFLNQLSLLNQEVTAYQSILIQVGPQLVNNQE